MRSDSGPLCVLRGRVQIGIWSQPTLDPPAFMYLEGMNNMHFRYTFIGPRSWLSIEIRWRSLLCDL